MLRTNGLRSIISLGGSMLVGMMAAASVPLRRVAEDNAAPVSEKKKGKRKRGRVRATASRWRGPTRRVPYSSARQGERYTRNDMIAQQAASHKPPAIWPAHLGISPHDARAAKVAAITDAFAAAFPNRQIELPEAPADV